jgi:hypothetical protein
LILRKSFHSFIDIHSQQQNMAAVVQTKKQRVKRTVVKQTLALPWLYPWYEFRFRDAKGLLMHVSEGRPCLRMIVPLHSS